jgi:hypothetical protein
MQLAAGNACIGGMLCKNCKFALEGLCPFLLLGTGSEDMNAAVSVAVATREIEVCGGADMHLLLPCAMHAVVQQEAIVAAQSS